MALAKTKFEFVAVLALVLASASLPSAFSLQPPKPTKRPDGLTISYETHWFNQKVDHFSWANTDTYPQRYLINKDHWCGRNCPILFYTGNEGDIEVFANNTGFMWENAATLNAMLVFAEHRFYGKSMPYKIDPTKISPTETKQLGYLSSEQALADYANLIHALKNKLYDAKYSPVIALGGSYGGMLAAWFRMKYPQIVTGALAGSAPILQFTGAYECNKFMQIVTKDFEGYSPNCSKSIAESWLAMRALATTQSGVRQLSSAFNTCSELSEQQVEWLIGLLSNIWVNMAMTDYANKASFLSDMPALPIKHACERLAQNPDDLSSAQLVANIAHASQVYTNFTGQLACLDIEKLVHDPMDVLWDFQSCTEMVMPICSDGVNDMFEPSAFDLATVASTCKRSWGVETQVDKIRIEYGLDKSLLTATNIIFSSCSRDPWSAGCPQESVPARQIHAIKIPGACHHEDLRPSGPNDSDAIKQARQDEFNIISQWINVHYANVKEALDNSTLVPATLRTYT